MTTEPKPTYRMATQSEIDRAMALAKCRLPAGTMTKRFARDLKYQIEKDCIITEKQASFLASCCYRFRRQMPPKLVPEIPPDGYETPKQKQERARYEAAMKGTR
jgi:hypothetical protein